MADGPPNKRNFCKSCLVIGLENRGRAALKFKGALNSSRMILSRCAAACLAIALAGCATVPPAGADRPSNELSAIETDLAPHIAVLASDEFGGRKPGTDGETKTLDYLVSQWTAAGLEGGTNNPANPWLAPVKISVSTPATSTVKFFRRGAAVAVPDNSVIAYSSGRRALLDRAPLLFVGKQYRELDRAELTGRVAVMLWDHPDQAEQHEALLERGASAVLAIVMNDGEMSGLVERRGTGSYRLSDDTDGSLLDGFMTPSAADAVLGEGRLARLRESADSPEFRPVPLPVTVSIEATATPGAIKTHNVIARLPARKSDLGGKPGAVLLVAHWDHFGTCAAPPAADLICNGAVDNASGLAVLIELARRLSHGAPLDRDIYFLATTGEEWGLLGARAFAADPPVPLSSIVAAFNVDSIAIAKRGAPVVIVGAGLTPLDGPIKRIIAAQGRKLGDAALAANFLRRQDGWVLLQHDVPTLMVSSAFADRATLEPYTANRYHLPSDQVAGIELGGAAQDLLLHLAMVSYFADSTAFPLPDETPNAHSGR